MKKCAVINDISGFGKCSLTAAIPIISVMGSEVHPLPTAVFSNQTAYDSYYGVSLTDSMPEIVTNWKKLNPSFDGILTGFVTDERQLDIIDEFISIFKSEKTILLVDPVMADNGAFYDGYNTDMCNKIKSICYKADIITPNIAELAFLADEKYSDNLDDILSYGKKLIGNGMKSVVATGYKHDDEISNIVFENDEVFYSTSKLIGGYFSGTGDITSSIIMGAVLRGMSLRDAVVLSSSFIEKAIRNTNSKNGNDGIEFEKFLGDLIYEK